MKNMKAFMAACAGMFLFGITLITLGSVIIDLKTKFGLSGIDAGTLFSILPFGILTGSLLFGPVCDRYGYKLLLVFACVAMFGGFQGIAYANSLGVLKFCIYLFGFGGGIINGATNAVVADISPDHKGANLSLLGVFFGLGALGMPLVIGMLANRVSSFTVVSAVGWLTLAVGTAYLFVQFPPAKPGQTGGVQWRSLFRPLLLLIAFFLFFQSSFEAIINNWATTFLTSRGIMSEEGALLALSLHVAGMVVMRLLTGSVLRRVSGQTILWCCLLMLALGIALMHLGSTAFIVTIGLVLSGAGLAGGFPLMLGFVGERFPQLSGTAFSFVFVVALVGNMLVNYVMGQVIERFGVIHLLTVSYLEIAAMALLFYFIIQKLKFK